MLTIVFATYNGSDTLGQMLQRFCELTLPPVDIEILMVNNGSDDSTVEVAQSFVDKLPLKILHENKRGKNRALNHGIKSAKGDLLLFTDDDVLPYKDWLIKVWECAEENRDADLFGGRILPYWDMKSVPFHLNSVPLTAAYGITPAELPAGPVPAGAIWGANMFVRKRVFDAGFLFNEQVGPGPGNYIMGSEVEFNQRIAAHGYKTWYCPEAIVQHIIHEHQTTRKWIRRRAYKFGKGIFERNREKINQGIVTTLAGFQLGFPRWMIRGFFFEWFHSNSSNMFRGKSDPITHLWNAYYYLGYMTQGRRYIKKWKATENGKPEYK